MALFAQLIRAQYGARACGQRTERLDRSYLLTPFRPPPRLRVVLRTAVGGRRYTARNAALNRRTLPNPAANAIEDIGIIVVHEPFRALNAPGCCDRGRRRPGVLHEESAQMSGGHPKRIGPGPRRACHRPEIRAR